MSAPYGPPPGGMPPPGWNPGIPTRRPSFGLDKIIALVVLALSLFILFLGGLLSGITVNKTSASFVSTFGWSTTFYLVAGLLAIGALLPKAGNLSFSIAAISLGASISLLFTLFGATSLYGTAGSIGAGFIITLILGFFQAAAAIVGYLVSAGVIKMTPKPAYGAYGPGYPPAGYGPPPGYGQVPQGYQQPPTGGQPPQGGPGYPTGPTQ